MIETALNLCTKLNRMAEEYFIGYARISFDALDFSHEWAKKYLRSNPKNIVIVLNVSSGKTGVKVMKLNMQHLQLLTYNLYITL
jgi:hypothetical protein